MAAAGATSQSLERGLAILHDVDVAYIERCRTAQPGQRDIDLTARLGPPVVRAAQHISLGMGHRLPPG